MEILKDKVLAKYLFERYANNPRDWKFIISKSSFDDGFFDATVSNRDEVWQLKIDSIYKPMPTVLGTKVDIDSVKFDKRLGYSTIPFGYRTFDPPVIMNLLDKLSQDHHSMNDTIASRDTMNSILSSLETVRPETGKNYVYGPLVFTESNHAGIDAAQKQISKNLGLQLRDNLRAKYSGYG
ncbi:MAG TPA: hypothetical protein VH500_19190 [Nitrososphaeraceae archaeon]|jgi:hypothetical protein